MSLHETQTDAVTAPETTPQAQADHHQSVLVVIPCLNEEAHIGGLLARLLADPGASDAIIAVVDGMSTDRTRDIVTAAAKRDPRVKLLHNQRRIQAAAVNLAAAHYKSEVLIRVDAHAGYPDDYCARLLAARTQTGADSVCVSMRAKADTRGWFQIANATAQNSRLGAGGSPHRRAGARTWVEHGHHALMRSDLFCAVGGYDERFTHNEDAELDVRLAARGARILLAADIVIDYYPRKRLRDLIRQYFAFGRGRARTSRLHKIALRPRQLLPLAAPAALALALFSPLSVWFAAPACGWIMLCISYGVIIGIGEREDAAMISGLPAMAIHLAWATGFLSAIGWRVRGGPVAGVQSRPGDDARAKE